ncbi:MAG: T9SS type A sorting domain-containing protein [Bacteroidetes bacterium]|nr:T9SS type A sorting domain-containing protein [Bacteroidota bacterium]
MKNFFLYIILTKLGILAIINTSMSQNSIIWSSILVDSTNYYEVENTYSLKGDSLLLVANVSTINDIDPIILKVDPSGVFTTFWTKHDSTKKQNIRNSCIDTIGNIWLISNSEPDSIHFIGIDGTYGTKIMETTLNATYFWSTIHQYAGEIYFALANPTNTLFKYSSSGNLIWQTIIPAYFHLNAIEGIDGNIYVMGDTLSSNGGWYPKICKYDTAGVFISSVGMTYGNNKFCNALTVEKNLWMCGMDHLDKAYCAKVDTNLTIQDTTIGGPFNKVSKSKIVLDSNLSIYWSYIIENGSKECHIAKIDNQAIAFNVIDTCFSEGWKALYYKGFDIIVTKKASLLVANTYWKSPIFDYQLAEFDTAGNQLWDTRYTNSSTSKEMAFRLNETENFYYLSGSYSGVGGISGINVLKMANVSSINNHLGINETLYVHPNPNYGGTIYLSKQVQNAEVSIYNSKGRMVDYYMNFSGNQLKPHSALSSGLYFISITEQNKCVTKKLIIINENE